jgi:hypothetical protein
MPSLNASLLLWSTKLRHLPMPFVIRQFIAFVTFPLFLAVATDARKAFGIAVQALQRSDIVYCYGGTSLSGQWFWGNIYYYLLVGPSVAGRIFTWDHSSRAAEQDSELDCAVVSTPGDGLWARHGASRGEQELPANSHLTRIIRASIRSRRDCPETGIYC